MSSDWASSSQRTASAISPACCTAYTDQTNLNQIRYGFLERIYNAGLANLNQCDLNHWFQSRFKLVVFFSVKKIEWFKSHWWFHLPMKNYKIIINRMKCIVLFCPLLGKLWQRQCRDDSNINTGICTITGIILVSGFPLFYWQKKSRTFQDPMKNFPGPFRSQQKFKLKKKPASTLHTVFK